ncbi:MAG TPA: DUF2784 domain-containing protein [bacterium]|nr:DUF2784 domain-containing protein [bacterium]
MQSPLLADVVVLLHLLYVGFVVAGFVAVPLGWALDWGWVRSRTLRRLHLAAIALVALEALVGVVCPLTEWEAWLRGSRVPGTFVGRLVHAVLFYNLPGWVFTAAYVALTVLALALYRLVPPRSRSR